ncbi:protein of unknown function [Methylorubrum extorquens]|uniref:Uncharacterized protein n=1 Tax=Methylorubrum extorquens TaxID=408 RepID=A0A2N9ALQ8_METEX|nr:protein of unknown function [Methylorubrum extorquens]
MKCEKERNPELFRFRHMQTVRTVQANGSVQLGALEDRGVARFVGAGRNADIKTCFPAQEIDCPMHSQAVRVYEVNFGIEQFGTAMIKGGYDK